MRYLITTKDGELPFFTDWFDSENFFNKEIGMIVYDLIRFKFTADGEIWQDIEFDNL
jgi:hypothetical protein